MSTQVEDRREKVYRYRIKGLTQEKIREKIGCSRQTIVRDCKIIKENAKKWLDDLAKDGYINEYKMLIDQEKYREQELQQLFDKETDPIKKIKINHALNENVKLLANLLDDLPAMHYTIKRSEENESV